MPNVAIEKIRDEDATPPTVFERMMGIAEKIRQRAFEIFQGRGCADGRSVEDWLQAEREVIQCPEAELIEKDGKFRLRMAVPGFGARDVHVTAMPSAIIVRAEAKHKHAKAEGDVYFCEFGQRQLFRRLDLPAPINPDKVTGRLDQGVLHVIAEKRVDVANKVKAIAAA